MRIAVTFACLIALVAAPVAARTLGPPVESRAPVAATASPSRSPFLVEVGPDLRDGPALRRAAALAAARREDVDVLVDKRRGLPADHRPRDLVAPRVRFLAGVAAEERLLRRRAARALERMVAAAGRDGVELAGVSGFRSFATQRALFARYARERGVEDAGRVSARAGHSEHQTGLAIDVAGADGRCAAQRCFAGTRPARWLARHAADHGFVVRYPPGKRRITGYDHEPWHLRYVGRALARAAVDSGRTLDELLRPR